MRKTMASPSQPTKQQVEASLRILSSKDSSLEEKRRAFDVAQSRFVPITNRTKEYAAELARVFGLRFAPWQPPPPRNVPSHASGPTAFCEDPDSLADGVRGLIYGAALGDATGLSTEFMSRAEIARNYDAQHVFRPGARVHPDLHRLNFLRGDWTDDTDQLVLMMQTLLEHEGRYDSPSFARKLLAWKDEGFPGLGDQGGAGLGRTTLAVMRHKDFGTNPQAVAADVWKRGGRRAAPNGAVMRTAITGVPFFWSATAVQCNTMDFCKATHANPRCVASCLVVAECVRLLLVAAAESPKTVLSVEAVDEIIAKGIQAGVAGASDLTEEYAEELHAHALVRNLEDLELDVQGIGYTFKCMGCGLWALHKAAEEVGQRAAAAAVARDVAPGNASFADILQEVIRAGGDADTNGAVAGALLGAFLGSTALPWLGELPYGGWLEAWVQKLLFMLRLPVTIGS